MTNNQNRSNRFEEVVIVYGDDEPDTNLIDLLADAMHWCDHTGRDFHIALAQACRHYIHELNDQQQDERRLIP
jgi:hypothetical protein